MPLINPRYFVIEQGRIVFSPRLILKYCVLIGLPVFICCSLLFLNSGFFGKILLIFAVTGFLVTLPLYLISCNKVIIDGINNAVYRTSVFGSKKIYDLQDVKLDYVQDLSFGTANNGYFKLTPIENPYGKGIPLHNALGIKSKPYREVKEIAVPYVEKLLAGTTLNATRATPVNTGEFKHFKTEGTTYVSKRYKIFYLCLGLLFIGASAYWLIEGLGFGNKDIWYAVVIGVVGIYYISMWNERVIIDTTTATLTTSFFLGLKKERLLLNNIVGFTTLRHLAYGLHNGTDIIATLNNKKNVSIFNRIGSAKRLNGVMNELRIILSNSTNYHL